MNPDITLATLHQVILQQLLQEGYAPDVGQLAALLRERAEATEW